MNLQARRGMTMIEIMVVLTVLAILMAVALPTMRAVNDRNRLRAAAREMLGIMKVARSEAILGQRATTVYLDLQKREYWLDLRRVDEKTGKPVSDKKKSQYEEKRPLERDIAFEEVTVVEDNVIDDKYVAIDFYPDGSATPAAITFADVKLKRVTVEVLKASGLVEISNGTIEQKRAKEQEDANG